MNQFNIQRISFPSHSRHNDDVDTQMATELLSAFEWKFVSSFFVCIWFPSFTSFIHSFIHFWKHIYFPHCCLFCRKDIVDNLCNEMDRGWRNNSAQNSVCCWFRIIIIWTTKRPQNIYEKLWSLIKSHSLNIYDNCIKVKYIFYIFKKRNKVISLYVYESVYVCVFMYFIPLLLLQLCTCNKITSKQQNKTSKCNEMR